MDAQNQEKEHGFGLIMEHLTGSTSEEAQKQLDEWRSLSDENERLFEWMTKMWRSLSLSDHDKTFDRERAYRLFCERVEAETAGSEAISNRRSRTTGLNKVAETGQTKQIPIHSIGLCEDANSGQIKRIQLWRRIASIAAVLIPMAILGYYTYRYFTIVPLPNDIPLKSEIMVPAGSKTQMSLQDGTKVWLNADSHLQYDSDFGRSNRTITLQGEAYFEVAKDENSPFIVNVGGIKIKVLGTHFNVNAYHENNGVVVSLLEGSVEMITTKSNTMLQPGNMARYDAVTGKVAVTTKTEPQSVEKTPVDNVGVQKMNALDKNHAIDWMSNRLVFHGETFEQIICTLERAYNVKVNIHNNQIKKRQFGGDFTNNETIEQIMTVMSLNGKFQFQIKGNVIDIF